MYRTLSNKIPYIKEPIIFTSNKESIKYNLFKKNIIDTSKVTYKQNKLINNIIKYNDEIKYYNQNFNIKKNSNWQYEW